MARAPRKSKKEPEEVQELRQENEDLRRTVSRLRKRLKKLEPVETEEVDEVVIKPEALPFQGAACPKCFSIQFTLFHTPTATLRICGVCKGRTKV